MGGAERPLSDQTSLEQACDGVQLGDLPSDLGEVHRVARILHRAGRLGRAGPPRSPEEPDDLGEGRRPNDLQTSTSAASSALEVGTTTPRRPARLAAIATESTPGVEISPPRSESSPANTHPSSLAGGTWAIATSTPIATGRSSPGPSFRSVPGERLTTTRRSGHSNPALSTAGLIRSRASWTPAPGRPVSVSDGSPRPTCASTVTR
jgi:hypothetical protein